MLDAKERIFACTPIQLESPLNRIVFSALLMHRLGMVPAEFEDRSDHTHEPSIHLPDYCALAYTGGQELSAQIDT